MGAVPGVSVIYGLFSSLIQVRRAYGRAALGGSASYESPTVGSWVQSPRFRVTCLGPVRCELAVFSASRVEFKGSRLTKGEAQSGLPFRRSCRVKPGG